MRQFGRGLIHSSSFVRPRYLIYCFELFTLNQVIRFLSSCFFFFCFFVWFGLFICLFVLTLLGSRLTKSLHYPRYLSEKGSKKLIQRQCNDFQLRVHHKISHRLRKSCVKLCILCKQYLNFWKINLQEKFLSNRLWERTCHHAMYFIGWKFFYLAPFHK